MLAAWRQAAAKGYLGRDEMLDTCLDAFTRDYNRLDEGWFARLHERLAPDGDEVAIRAQRYLALLTVSSPRGVKTGQHGCRILSEDDRLPVAAFLAVSPPALVFRQKDIAMTQLKLIAAITARQPQRGRPRSPRPPRHSPITAKTSRPQRSRSSPAMASPASQPARQSGTWPARCRQPSLPRPLRSVSSPRRSHGQLSRRTSRPTSNLPPVTGSRRRCAIPPN
jgi:hypothetical protein